MALEQVFAHALSDDFGVVFQRVGISIAHLGGDFVADMNQLTKTWIETRLVLVVTQGRSELLAIPMIYFAGGGQFGGVDVDDGGVRRAQLSLFGQRFSINIACDLQTVIARKRQSDDFFEPRRARRFKVQTGAMFGQLAANRRVNREFIAARMHAEF